MSDQCQDIDIPNCQAVPSEWLHAHQATLAQSGRWYAPLTYALFFSMAICAWSGTFVEMWWRWFPAWRLDSLSLYDRLTGGDSYYAHGPFVPLVSVLMAYAIFKKSGWLSQQTRLASISGWVIFVISISLHLISVYARIMFVSGFAMIGALAGMVLITGGWRLLRAYWFPIVNLIFLVPIPLVWIADLNFSLKHFAATTSTFLTNTLFHIPAVLEGSYIHLLPGADGTAKSLVVGNVCGGLRSLISLLWFSMLLTVTCRLRGWSRGLLFALALPVALLWNVLRITTLSLTAHWFGTEVIAEGQWVHEITGLGVYVMAILTVLFLERVLLSLIALGRKLKTANRQSASHIETMKGSNSDRDGESQPEKSRWLMPPVSVPVLATLSLTALISLVWFSNTPELSHTQRAASALPTSLTIQQAHYRGRDIPLDKKTINVLFTQDYVSRSYRTHGKGLPFVATLIHGANQRQTIHPPDVCLEGNGEQIIAKRLIPIQFRVGEDRINTHLRELVTQRGSRLTLHLYIYKTGNQFTPYFFEQQASIFLGQLFTRNHSAALLRISIPVPDRHLEQARAFGIEAAQILLASVGENLP